MVHNDRFSLVSVNVRVNRQHSGLETPVTTVGTVWESAADTWTSHAVIAAADIAQSLATNSPAPGPRPLTCGVSSECLGTKSYETTSRDQRGKIQMFFSSTGACTVTKSPIANHRSSIVAQLYFASVTQMFLMSLFVKVESGSSKLLRTVSKSGPNGCKERSRPQKMLMRIKIESF